MDVVVNEVRENVYQIASSTLRGEAYRAELDRVGWACWSLQADGAAAELLQIGTGAAWLAIGDAVVRSTAGTSEGPTEVAQRLLSEHCRSVPSGERVQQRVMCGLVLQLVATNAPIAAAFDAAAQIVEELGKRGWVDDMYHVMQRP